MKWGKEKKVQHKG